MVNFRKNILIFFYFERKSLTYSTITLFGTVVILLVSLHINKWQLDKKLGCFLMVIYILFIALAAFF
jgi:solute carrier family 24 (sodium/potassium/calcium exchanger), member 4